MCMANFRYTGPAFFLFHGRCGKPVLYVNARKREQTGRCGAMMHPICASISRSVPTSSECWVFPMLPVCRVQRWAHCYSYVVFWRYIFLVRRNKRSPRPHGGRATVKQLVSEDNVGGLWWSWIKKGLRTKKKSTRFGTEQKLLLIVSVCDTK